MFPDFPASEVNLELADITASLNARLDSMTDTLVEALDEGGDELAMKSLALAIMLMTPGEVIDLALVAVTKVAKEKIAKRDAK